MKVLLGFGLGKVLFGLHHCRQWWKCLRQCGDVTMSDCCCCWCCNSRTK